MDLVVSPIAVALNTQSGGNPPSFTPGQVVDALVLRLIDQTHVQLAVGNSLIDVQTAVPLQLGAHVQLAVRATPDGLRLVLLHPDEIGTLANGAGAAGLGGARTAQDAATARPNGDPATVPAQTVASPQAALAQAVRTAAVLQDSLAPLLANVAVAMKLGGIPDAVRTAAVQLMSFRLPTDAPVKADDIARALSRSGLFLEAGLATGAASGQTAAAGDLKAALVALRAALATMVGSANAPDARLQGAIDAALSGPAQAGAGRPDAIAGQPGGAQALYRALAQAMTANALPGGATPSGAAEAAAPQGLYAESPAAPNRPPPPYRGAAPVAQPISPASILDGAEPRAAARTLLAETDAALARHTLLQAASLPDSPGTPATTDTGSGRWVFEIPFATPQGTTVAQFEIARDGKGEGAERHEASWRARFAIDVEPVGVVHAQITVAGERTGVTLWAERGSSAELLRDHAGDLAERLRAADLDPSEVVVRDGAPPRPRETAAPAGRFLDRAS